MDRALFGMYMTEENSVCNTSSEDDFDLLCAPTTLDGAWEVGGGSCYDSSSRSEG